jgi:type VI secretion system protein ImpC
MEAKMGNKAVEQEIAQTESVPPSILEKIVQEGRMVRDDSQREYAKDLISEFASQVLAESMVVAKDMIAALEARIAAIDQVISNQLNAIMHHKEFQELEASWRGLHYLVYNTETGHSLKLKLLNISKSDLQNDLEKAVDFDQSQIFKKVYEEEFGTFGGAPFGLLLGDYDFGRTAQEVALLEKIASIAASAHAPFIAAANPKLFDVHSFADITAPRDLSKIFESNEMVKWRSFRESEDSRYVALTLPRILIRPPYGENSLAIDELNFNEDVSGKESGKYLWGNPAYALARTITSAFSKYKWCAAIRGVEGGGLVEGLPVHTFKTDDGDTALKCPTEIAITDRRERELNDLGFITLVHCKGTDYAAFFGGQTVNRPKQYDTVEANANARISAILPYILAASRFAQYLKAIMRDKIGSFTNADSIQSFLNRWISNYVLGKDDAGQEMKARYPLREARVDVFEMPGKPGCYNAVIFLRPHFQLEELTTSIRLVAELPQSAAK